MKTHAKKKLNWSDIAIVVLFLGILYAVFIINLLKPADKLSVSERRKLAQFPDISVASILDKKSMDGFDNYAVDQMAFRENYRRLKALFDINVWFKSDNNAIFVAGDQVFKTEYPMNENSARRLCDIINYVYGQFLEGMNVHYALVPDKNYYLEDTRHLIMDYPGYAAFIRDNIRGEVGDIDLFDELALDSYFMTDSHWKQDMIGGVVDAIAAGLGSDMRFDADSYERESYSPFYGVYYGQSALNVKPDELVYLVNDTTENAVVTSIEQPGAFLDIYDTNLLGGMDSYNLFMQGPQAIIRAENPYNVSGRELIIIRDSYASSLAPLLLPGYSAVTLVDLRYILPNLLGQFIDFTNQDVLFLYSATLFNNSDSIKSPPQQSFVSPFLARSAN